MTERGGPVRLSAKREQTWALMGLDWSVLRTLADRMSALPIYLTARLVKRSNIRKDDRQARALTSSQSVTLKAEVNRIEIEENIVRSPVVVAVRTSGNCPDRAN